MSNPPALWGRPIAGCPGAELVPSDANIELVRTATLCLINRERVARSERPLQDNGQLQRAAQSHTDSMASGSYFNHVGPGGGGRAV